MTAATNTAPASPAVGLGALWFGLFGAPFAWSVQELVGYAVVGHACYPFWRPLALPFIGGTWAITAVVSAGMLVLGAAAALTAWRSWRRTEPPHPDPAARQAEAGEGRARFMAMSGLLVSGMILFTMAMNAIVLFLVPPCG